VTGNRPHPLDSVLDAMSQAMDDADETMAKMADGIGDFDSQKLTAAEDELVFAHPMVRYPDQVDPTNGAPMTNQQAAWKLLEEMGPEAWAAHVQDFVRRADRRSKEGSPNA
jgi:hypothetical protein